MSERRKTSANDVVLVVEDSPTAQFELKRLLEGLGYEVVTAGSGSEALELFGHVLPDAVMLDIYMPGMSGLETLEQLRQRDAYVAIVIMTASSSEENAVAALRGGADDYVTKPVEQESFHRSLKNSIMKCRLLRENARLIEQLKEVNRRLEKSSQVKSEFLANTSHELRTPLNSIIGFSELLADGAYGDMNRKQKEHVEIICESGRTLLSLINGLLDFSKIEAGKMRVLFRRIDHRRVIEKVVRNTRVLIRNKDVEINMSFGKGPETIIADEERLEQILTNLVSNAIKFISDNGHITISTTVDSENVIFSVKDDGIGIKKDDLKIIFEAFRQIDNSSSKQYMGTGLGLTLTERLVRMHGGRIWCDSTYGEGSEFYFTVPLNLQESEIDMTPGRKPSMGSVLVIDDNEETVELFSLYLMDRGYNFLVARTGEGGLRVTRKNKPDAILLDILLPDMSGWDVLTALKEDPSTKDIPVIVCSMISGRPTSVRLGAAAYVVKPVDRSHLYDLLQEHVKVKS